MGWKGAVGMANESAILRPCAPAGRPGRTPESGLHLLTAGAFGLGAATRRGRAAFGAAFAAFLAGATLGLRAAGGAGVLVGGAAGECKGRRNDEPEECGFDCVHGGFHRFKHGFGLVTGGSIGPEADTGTAGELDRREDTPSTGHGSGAGGGRNRPHGHANAHHGSATGRKEDQISSRQFRAKSGTAGSWEVSAKAEAGGTIRAGAAGIVHESVRMTTPGSRRVRSGDA